MNQPTYEHHYGIRQNKLCPFFLRTGKGLRDTVANWHKNIEVFFITGGEGHIRCGVAEYALTAGNIVIVNSGTVHRIYSAKGIDYFCVIVDDAFCRENGLDTEHTRFEEHFCDGNTERIYMEMIGHLQKNDSENQLQIAKTRHAVLNLLIDLFEHHCAAVTKSEGAQPRSDEYVKKAILYINDSYASPITLEDIAKAVGISRFHLSREFKKYTNQTLFTYLNTLRCKNAELCIQRGMSVTQAAYENGFETLSYFSRTYKKLMGTPPSGVT
ncbi:MAG: helix-turn-helix transcriptional regulator [Clostridia bacterium]|nr:helix-turn-helix transcriptional regulator [Clostridia bacterium]